jgi:outer membrane lipoprotein-sorting protein
VQLPRGFHRRRPLPARWQVALVAAIAAGGFASSGCTSHHGRQAPPSSSQAQGALQGLQAQATEAETRSFTASYEAQGGSPPSTTVIKVYRTPSAARIDVNESGTIVRIVVNDNGTYSCKVASGTAPLCVTLAGPGQDLQPSLALQLQLQLLFTSGPAELAKGTGFEVKPAGSKSAQVSAPAAACYAIVSVPKNSDVAPGTYCFSDGLLVSAQFRTGSLQLKSLGAQPVASDFTLPASPVPLPSENPAASASSSR